MRKALLSAAVALLGAGAAEAKRLPVIGPLKCPNNGGSSNDPFYGVTAIQDMMPGPGPRKPLSVAGRYWLNLRTGRVMLLEAHHGHNARILRLELRHAPGGSGGCAHFSASFRPASARQVQITDWNGRRIRVNVQRPR
jgi:hypothetical protein